MRRVLAYSLNNLLGFMVIGVGIGSQLAINGTVAHAFASIIYQALLFMCVGAVIYRTGTGKGSALGGLWKHMPMTALFCLVGAASISSVPLFSSFVTKSLTLGAAAQAEHFWVWGGMVVASVGVLLHSGIKVPLQIFGGPARAKKVEEAPLSMLVAMGLSALLCVLIGVMPGLVYALLPYEVTYQAWTLGHVLSELQLLAFAGLVVATLLWKSSYPPQLDMTVLNSDWLYRLFAPRIARIFYKTPLALWHWLVARGRDAVITFVVAIEHASRQSGVVSGVASTGAAAGIFLAVFALLLLFRLVM